MAPPTSSNFIIPLVSFNNTRFVKRLGAQLREDGHDYVVLPKNEYVKKEADSQLPEGCVLESVSSYTPENSLSELLKKYEIKSSRDFVFTDMVYNYDYLSPDYSFYFPNRELPYEEYENRLHRWLDKVDALYDSEGYIPIQNQGGEIFRRCLHTVAKHHGYPTVWRGFSPVERMCGLHTNPTMYFDGLDDVSYDELSDEEKQDAEELIRQITTEYNQYTDPEKTLSDRVHQKVQALRSYGDDFVAPTVSWLRESLLGGLKKAYFNRVYADREESIDFVENESFVYYPLQYFRESRVTYRSNAFYNQLWLVEYLSRSLPHGRELAVKDHPHLIGAQPVSVPRKLARVAKPLETTLNSRRIIENAEAVVTLNNTVGFEALMYGKPVVTLGDGFYADSEYVHSVEDINDIGPVLHRAVESDGISDEQIVEVAAAIVQGSYPGRWGDATESNVKQFANSVQEFLSDEGVL